MSNYVYKDVVPFSILDAGFYLPVIKQGVATNTINTLESYDSGEDSGLGLVPISGILFTISKQIWDAYKNTISYTDFLVNVKIASNNQTYFSDRELTSLSCVFGEEYDNINYVTLLGILSGGTHYAPTKNVNLEITYTSSNIIFTRNNIPIKTAGGRIIGRHVNWEGSVINFDQYGTRTNLFVPDAKFRDLGDYSISNKIISTDTQMHSPIFDISTENHMSAKYVYLIADGRKEDNDYFTNTEYLTDTQLQSKIDSLLNNAQSFANDFTAKEGTDAILALDSNSKAANYVRSVIPSKLTPCNIPNFYELCVLYLESDNIDLLDYDIRYTPNFPTGRRLGAPARFNGRAIEKQSCTEVSIIGSSGSQSFEGLHLNNGGLSRMYGRYTTIGVIPVLEL